MTKYDLLSKKGSDDQDSELQSDHEHIFLHSCRTLLVSFSQSLQNLVSSSVSQYRLSFRSLSSCPHELYINFCLKFFESYNYFAISQILVIYLHQEFNVSDMEAGGAYGLWGASITFWGMATSWINDNLGVRRSLLIGFTISFLSTMMMAWTRNKTILYLILFGIFPVGTSMGIPMLTVGVRRYTNPTNRGFAFGLYYSVMNVAAFVSGPVVDLFNISLKDGTVLFGSHFSGNRLVILTASLVCLCSVILTYTSLREIRVSDSEPIQVVVKDEDSSSHVLMSHMEVEKEEEIMKYEVKRESLWSISRTLCSSPTFWRFSVFVLLLVNLNAIFRHLDATLPTYLIRCFGSNVDKGLIYSINPFIIILLTPPIAAFTSTSPHFDMIKYGGYLTAISPFFLAFSTSIWAAICFVSCLSFGEAIWSPRVYDYTMSIAPEGREASFSALASAPLFAAKIPVGLLSGYLISTYLSEDGSRPRDGRTLWLIVGLVTLFVIHSYHLLDIFIFYFIDRVRF